MIKKHHLGIALTNMLIFTDLNYLFANGLDEFYVLFIKGLLN